MLQNGFSAGNAALGVAIPCPHTTTLLAAVFKFFQHRNDPAALDSRSHLIARSFWDHYLASTIDSLMAVVFDHLTQITEIFFKWFNN